MSHVTHVLFPEGFSPYVSCAWILVKSDSKSLLDETISTIIHSREVSQLVTWCVTPSQPLRLYQASDSRESTWLSNSIIHSMFSSQLTAKVVSEWNSAHQSTNQTDLLYTTRVILRWKRIQKKWRCITRKKWRWMTRKPDGKKAAFLAVVEARKAIFWQNYRPKVKIFDSCGLSAKGALIYAST